jgi:hypothetical protein
MGVLWARSFHFAAILALWFLNSLQLTAAPIHGLRARVNSETHFGPWTPALQVRLRVMNNLASPFVDQLPSASLETFRSSSGDEQ